MSARLSKVTKECNVGLQTAVEFLHKHGFTDIEANPNLKISDEQYDLLVKEFVKDKNLRNEVEQFREQRQKVSKENKRKEELVEPYPVAKAELKVVGHIDLNAKKTVVPAPKAEEPVKVAEPVKAEEPA